MNDTTIRSLSAQESRVVLSLAEYETREASRRDIIRILGVSPEAADHVIRSLRRKGWLERASWGRYLLIPADQGPDALGESNVLALASLIADPYYIGYGTAAAHYGFTTQRRNIIWLVTPQHLRDRKLLNAHVRIVNLGKRKFFAYGPVDVLGHEVKMSDVEKTAIDCVDRPDLCGGFGEATYIFGRACWKANWDQIFGYLRIIGAAALIRKVGWLADHVGAPVPDYVRTDLLEISRKTKSKTVFGPMSPEPDAPGYQREWNLSVNVTKAELKESEGIARRHFAKKEP
jgi:predicted transcriptional regulator of viral defense system